MRLAPTREFTPESKISSITYNNKHKFLNEDHAPSRPAPKLLLLWPLILLVLGPHGNTPTAPTTTKAERAPPVK
jgi:hypothetical protein